MSWHTSNSDLGTHICIKLINLVKQHPMIYLSSKESAPHPRKNRNEINQIWAKIARDIGLSVEDCKRRWKGLKDVYAKIRKRRLQEGVLGITARKKWLYEDFMSFMKFPFEKAYQKALENFEDVDCNEWKIDDAESNDTAEETFVDADEHLASTDTKPKAEAKLEEQEQDQMEDGTIEYLDLDLEVDSVPDTETYDQIQSSEREDNHSESIMQTQVSKRREKPGRGADAKLRSKYRAIRPKPYQSNLSTKTRTVRSSNAAIRSSSSSATPVVNVSNLSPLNQIIVTSQPVQRGKNCEAVILSSPNMKVRKYGQGRQGSEGVSSTSGVTMRLDSSENRRIDSSPASSQIESLSRMSAKRSSISSVELFFQSMAQTVMNLPMRAQAEIKMEICKVVTRAEIQHTLSQSSSNLESHKSRKS